MNTCLLNKTLFLLSLFLVTAMACDLTFTVAPSTSQAPLSTNTAITVLESPVPASATPISATLVPEATATALQPSFDGVEASAGPLHVVLPTGLATGARGSQIPRTDGQNVAPWDVTPGHIELKLEGYPLQGRAHEPRILVYQALEYAQMYPAAFESMHRLDNIVLGDLNAPISAEQLPAVPFFNMKQAFASHIQMLSFQNGRGVRFLTEYAQYAVSANNHDLFYQFQGFTSDGKYYIVAILPITTPLVAETSDAGAPLPAGGVPYPYFADPNADMQSYYHSVVDVLNATPSELFGPSLNQLDLLIQSMRVTP